MTDARAFRGFRFPAEVILWAVRWYLQFPISYRDLELMLADRGVEADHTTMYRWVQRFAPELEKRVRRHLRPCRGPWHVDETYVRVGGEWRYLYRAVDGTGQTIDFLLSAKRDKKAAKRFFRKALGRENTRNPREIVTDRLKSYPGALREMKREGELWRFTRHRRGQWLNNLVEQDHRRVKRLTGPMLGFQSFWTARRTLAGVEAMAMLAKGQVRAVPAADMPASGALYTSSSGLRPERTRAGRRSSAVSRRNGTPPRTMRTSTAWTRRSRATALQSSRRRRKVEPQARPAVARSSRHCMPSRTKNRSAATTLIVGTGGRPVPDGRSSIRSMIPATNAVALDAMLASPCQRHGKRTLGLPDAERLTTNQGLWKPPLNGRA